MLSTRYPQVANFYVNLKQITNLLRSVFYQTCSVKTSKGEVHIFKYVLLPAIK